MVQICSTIWVQPPWGGWPFGGSSVSHWGNGGGSGGRSPPGVSAQIRRFESWDYRNWAPLGELSRLVKSQPGSSNIDHDQGTSRIIDSGGFSEARSVIFWSHDRDFFRGQGHRDITPYDYAGIKHLQLICVARDLNSPEHHFLHNVHQFPHTKTPWQSATWFVSPSDQTATQISCRYCSKDYPVRLKRTSENSDI